MPNAAARDHATAHFFYLLEAIVTLVRTSVISTSNYRSPFASTMGKQKHDVCDNVRKLQQLLERDADIAAAAAKQGHDDNDDDVDPAAIGLIDFTYRLPEIRGCREFETYTPLMMFFRTLASLHCKRCLKKEQQAIMAETAQQAKQHLIALFYTYMVPQLYRCNLHPPFTPSRFSFYGDDRTSLHLLTVYIPLHATKDAFADGYYFQQRMQLPLGTNWTDSNSTRSSSSSRSSASSVNELNSIASILIGEWGVSPFERIDAGTAAAAPGRSVIEWIRTRRSYAISTDTEWLTSDPSSSSSSSSPSDSSITLVQQQTHAIDTFVQLYHQYETNLKSAINQWLIRDLTNIVTDYILIRHEIGTQ